MILEDPSPLSRFEKWDATHKHPYGRPISSQRSSELFASIDETGKKNYFRLQKSDIVNVIELFQTKGQNRQVGEILQKQRDLFIAMDVPIPS